MLDYFNSAVEFVKQFKPTQTYEIAGITVGQESIISEGGYGYVYLAHDKQNYSRKYALKKILIQDQTNEKAVMREVSLWAKLGDHPNICKYIGHIETEGMVVILCEYCSQGTLVDLLQKYDCKLVEEQVLYIMKQICKGIKHMHDQDPPIAHRDIKIENILMHDEVVKLADFGSCSVDTLDHTRDNKRVIGEMMELFEKYTTMMYRPPEMIDQYKRYYVGTKVDIWMLGCVLYTLCFAKHPFQDSQKLAIVNSHYYMPGEDKQRIGIKLRDLIRLMLTPDPEVRPDINKIISILNEWDIIENIPLNEEANSIKIKQEAVAKAKNKKYKEISEVDLLGFEPEPKPHQSVKHCKSF